MTPVPKQIHFVWLGPPRIDVKNDKGELIGFQYPNLEQCRQKNVTGLTPDRQYKIHVWIDCLSMDPTRNEQLVNSVNKAIGTSFESKWPEAAAGVDPLTVGPYASGALDTALVEASGEQKGYGMELRMFANKPVHPNIEWFRKFCTDNNFTLHYLDELYAKWLKDEKNMKTRQLAKLILLEKFARGGNYGAASDMIRIQLLLEQGGIYSDHDTIFIKGFGSIAYAPNTTNPIPGDGTVDAPNGFLDALASTGDSTRLSTPTNAVLATAAEDNPVLRWYKQLVIKMYSAHLSSAEKFMAWVRLKIDYPPDPNSKVPSLYELTTLNTSGPSAMRLAIQEYFMDHFKNEPEAQRNKDVSDQASKCHFPFQASLFEVRSAKAWLQPDEEDDQ